MGHEVRTHTRRTASGKTVTVRQHTRTDDGVAPVNAPLDDKDQEKRDRLERRVQRERHAAERRDLLERHGKGKPAKRSARAPGERRKRKSRAPARAKRHARKARRLFRRHKAKALGYGLLALAEILTHGAGNGARKLHRRRK